MVYHRHSRPWSALVAAAAIVLIGGASASFAADSPVRARKAKAVASKAASKAKQSAPAPGAAGMRIAIDPETGLLIKPTLAQRHALGTSAELDRSSEGLVIITLADGTQICHLEGRFQEYVVARKDAAGNLRTDCVEGHDRARRLQVALPVARTGHVRADESTRVKE